MKIEGIFVGDAGFIEARLISPSLHLDNKISFLIDTGASKTTLLDWDAIRLGVKYEELTPAPFPLTGIGGAVTSYYIQDTTLIFASDQQEVEVTLPVYVLKHSLENMVTVQGGDRFQTVCAKSSVDLGSNEGTLRPFRDA